MNVFESCAGFRHVLRRLKIDLIFCIYNISASAKTFLKSRYRPAKRLIGGALNLSLNLKGQTVTSVRLGLFRCNLWCLAKSFQLCNSDKSRCKDKSLIWFAKCFILVFRTSFKAKRELNSTSIKW